jgi:hypothetical protein
VSIPRRAHFIWLGRDLPWVNVLAIRSAATRGGFERVTLHHDEDLSAAPHYGALRAIDRLELRRLDLDAVIGRCGEFAPALKQAYPGLPTPSIRKDLIRYALLFHEGGVYLDLDTVTVGSFEDFCAETEAFVGEERIVFPGTVKRSWNPIVQLLAQLRNGLRDLLALIPSGWAAFRAIERFYPRAVNNAIIGSAPRSAFVTRALERIAKMPPEVQRRSCGIGPHLFQELATEFTRPQLVVHPPAVFYPLGPVVSRHWFTLRRRDVPLERVLMPDTRVVHWYASIRNQLQTAVIDPDYVRANARRQLFSQLALPFAGG